MFLITEQDIGALCPTALRRLVALLVEATARAGGLSTAGIRAGGADTTPDGGLDVVAEFDSSFFEYDRLRRRSTGFQVKKSAMGPADIRKEMCPGGILRQAISDLASESGAYLIVTSGESLTEATTQRRARLRAMREAVGDVGNLHVDIIDRGQLATWANDFPGVGLWVREQVGRGTDGWRPYSRWSRVPATGDRRFIADDAARFDIADADAGFVRMAGIPVVEGIARLRERLRVPGSSVRLVGLAGMGKTRLAEALFEKELAGEALPPEWAIYADAGSTPSPSPAEVVRRLNAGAARAVVVVDNCPPELHREVATSCHGSAQVSVLTIEYDVRDDLPEETHVFRLQPASDDSVQAIIAAHYPHVSEVDRRTTARFSGGNARIALALARTIGPGEGITGLLETELFERLFWQRDRSLDRGLMRTAMACSLLYSFEGESESGSDAELPRLSALAGQDIGTFRDYVADLQTRDLMQRRGPWRAVLPPAIANRLAVDALERFSLAALRDHLQFERSPRLWKSLARRIGMLRGSPSANSIAAVWLGAAGPLAEVANLNRDMRDVFRKIAPNDPSLTLQAIEYSAPYYCNGTDDSKNVHDFLAPILRAIAYDPELFCRSVSVLSRMSVHWSSEGSRSNCRSMFASLFSPYLSGTKASPSQRARFLQSLLASRDSMIRQVAVDGLRAWLNTGPYMSGYGLEFGGWSREYGYAPRTAMEVEEWFALGIDLALEAASKEPEVGGKLLADAMRDLWPRGLAHASIAAAARSMSLHGFWPAGWVSLRTVLAAVTKDGEPDAIGQVEALVEELGPKTLNERIRAYVLEERPWHFDGDDDEPETYTVRQKRWAQEVEEMGREAAGDWRNLDPIVPAIVSSDSQFVGVFASAIAQEMERPTEFWERLVDEALGNPSSVRQTALRGFLYGWQKRDNTAVSLALDRVVECPSLAYLVPWLHSGIAADPGTVGRLRRVIRSGGVSPSGFEWLAFAQSVTASDVVELLSELMQVPGGMQHALRILAMRLMPNAVQDGDQESLLDLGRKMLSEANTLDAVTANSGDYYVGLVVEKCLSGPSGVRAAKMFCRKIADPENRYGAVMRLRGAVLPVLFRLYPQVALDELLPPVGSLRSLPDGLTRYDEDDRRGNPVEKVSESVLLDWCQQNPSANFLRAAACVPLRARMGAEDEVAWHPLAAALLRNAPDPAQVLSLLSDRFDPRGGWGGGEIHAQTTEKNGRLLDSLPIASTPQVAQAIAEARSKVAKAARWWREWAARDRRAEQAFE